METYTLLRGFADSWSLLLMFVFFGAVFLWVIRPGSKAVHKETASMIFRNDDRPAPVEVDASTRQARQNPEAG